MMVKLSVPSKDLEPGMELAEPALNRLGQIIIISLAVQQVVHRNQVEIS
jgi:hypothetical protein